ncbi:hypothetical protein B0T17DRAFT_606333 [Bombardia bombarda]|uniref:Uncharacterized protein n=1 Tax=Bombardia bombarda TaxID=252184 RepID=A0AA39X7P2_9PEZI|nr:hypothetical protein B0T17DRAFT_606333 [Bombardia bombarda]
MTEIHVETTNVAVFNNQPSCCGNTDNTTLSTPYRRLKRAPQISQKETKKKAMPVIRQDPNLYGQPPPKKQKKEMSLSGSLAFTSQLSTLLASSNTTATGGRPRPSKSKTDDLFSGVKVKRKAAARDDDGGSKLVLKNPVGTEDEKAERTLARRKMESKARLYAAMQRGDYVGREIGLVDFDRKWAEKADKKTNNNASSSSSSSSSSEDSDQESDNNDTEIIEYEDEFGRLRRGTRGEQLRLQRRLARGQASTAELDHMSARPKAPEHLIFGDAVQAEAFVAYDVEAMEQLARKRDRSATPPPPAHYEADREIRTKGVGFYAFSKDEEKRKGEMKGLEKERERTEGLRREREERVRERRREVEERRRVVGERRARRLADGFLEALGVEIGGEGEGGDARGGLDWI